MLTELDKSIMSTKFSNLVNAPLSEVPSRLQHNLSLNVRLGREVQTSFHLEDKMLVRTVSSVDRNERIWQRIESGIRLNLSFLFILPTLRDFELFIVKVINQPERCNKHSVKAEKEAFFSQINNGSFVKLILIVKKAAELNNN